jgi:hypothetical protein
MHGDADRLEWSERDVVLLHWRLLQEVEALADPETPLEAKFDTLRWVFTEREKDDLPFSFVNCLRVVGCSPLSPIAYCGRVDTEEVRDCIRSAVRTWLEATLERYPDWVREAVRPKSRVGRGPADPQPAMAQRAGAGHTTPGRTVRLTATQLKSFARADAITKGPSMSPLNRAAFIAAVLALYAIAAYLDAPPSPAHLGEGHRHHAAGVQAAPRAVHGETVDPGGRHA